MLRRAYVTSRSVYRPRVNHIPARPSTTNKILYLKPTRHQLVYAGAMQRRGGGRTMRMGIRRIASSCHTR